MKYPQIQGLEDEKFLRLTGVKRRMFEKMISILKEADIKKKNKEKSLNERSQLLSSERVLNENVIGMLKRFKIISDRYRNRRKRFGLRFNLIAAIYNMGLA